MINKDPLLWLLILETGFIDTWYIALTESCLCQASRANGRRERGLGI